METTGRATATNRVCFCFAFVLLFVATLFVPVLPIYHPSAIYRPSDVIQAVLPIWAVYYRAYYSFDPAFLLWPILISHALFSYWLGRFLARDANLPTQFSLVGLLAFMSGVAICLPCLLAYGPIGFSMLFVGVLSGLIFLNVFGFAHIFGVRLVRIGRSGLILAIVLCFILAVSGSAIFLGSPNNGWLIP